MGKNRKKKYNKNFKQQSSTGAVSKPIDSSAVVKETSSLSQSNSINKQDSIYSAHAKEYRFITKDLYRVLVVNGLFFVAVVAVYYINKSNPFLQDWYNKIF